MIYKFLLVLGLLVMGFFGWLSMQKSSAPVLLKTTSPLCDKGSPSRAFSNEFLASAHQSCTSETDCCDQLMQKVNSEYTEDQKGMKDCEKLVAPHYLPRRHHCYLKSNESCQLDRQADGTWKATIQQAMVQCDCFTCLTP